MTTLVLNHCGRPIPKAFTEASLAAFIKSLKERGIKGLNCKEELVVVYVGEAQARQLNQEYRGKDEATDVLSFDSMEPGSLGELVLCLDLVRRQAKDHQLTVKQELSYLLLHGLLHLLGYDHEKNETEGKHMFALQDSVWESFWKEYRGPK